MSKRSVQLMRFDINYQADEDVAQQAPKQQKMQESIPSLKQLALVANSQLAANPSVATRPDTSLQEHQKAPEQQHQHYKPPPHYPSQPQQHQQQKGNSQALNQLTHAASMHQHPAFQRQSMRYVRRTRENLPRSTTNSLKHWLISHAHNPYPSEAEKKDMCDRYHLTMTQLNNWFINGRRRYLRKYIESMPETSGAEQTPQVSAVNHQKSEASVNAPLQTSFNSRASDTSSKNVSPSFSNSLTSSFNSAIDKNVIELPKTSIEHLLS